MSLTYLSGDFDTIGKRKSGGGGGGGRKSGGGKRAKKTKTEKKQGRKRVFKKVKKVAVAPARAAFLTVVRLNALKLGTFLARVWVQPNGKETLTKFWDGFGGDMTKLKQAIAKGSKQSINADDIGSAVAATIATATPIIIALAPILKQFKVAKNKKEAADFDKGVENGRKDLAEDPDVPESKVSMPKNKDAGIVADKNGESTEDSRPAANKPESETGGKDDGGGSGGGSNDDGTETATNGKKMSKGEAEKTLSSFFSPVGFYGKILMLQMVLNFDFLNYYLLSAINTYCFIALLLIPFATMQQNNLIKKISYAIAYEPFNLFNQFITLIKLKWQRI